MYSSFKLNFNIYLIPWQVRCIRQYQNVAWHQNDRRLSAKWIYWVEDSNNHLPPPLKYFFQRFLNRHILLIWCILQNSSSSSAAVPGLDWTCNSILKFRQVNWTWNEVHLGKKKQIYYSEIVCHTSQTLAMSLSSSIRWEPIDNHCEKKTWINIIHLMWDS